MLCTGLPGVSSAHDTKRRVAVPVQIQPVHGRAGAYQIAFGCIPADAVSGETVVCEIKLLPPRSDAAVSIEVSEGGRRVSLPIHHEDEAGVYGAEHRFAAAGTYAASVRVLDDPAAAFSIRVSTGILRWVRVAVAILLSLLAAWWGVRWIGIRRAAPDSTTPRPWAPAVAYVFTMVVVVAAADRFVAPIVGRAVLPMRANAAVDWGPLSPPELREHAGTLSELAESNSRTRTVAEEAPQSTESLELTGHVVARPGALADVFVSMTGRVVFANNFVPRIGDHVAAGQTLAVLEQHYVLHDAVHLINARWPIVVEMMAAKRRVLEAKAARDKDQYLYAKSDVSLKVLQDAETALGLANIDYDRSADALKAHDAQIAQRDLTTRPIAAPIAGTLIAVNFTQGQLAYEGERLFTIANVATVWVKVDVPEMLVERVVARTSQQRRASMSVFGHVFDAKFVKTAGVVDPVTRTVPFLFEATNQAGRLKLGMAVSVRMDEFNPRTGSSKSADGAPPLGRPDEVVSALGVVQADPRLEAHVVAPLWGRIEFAHRSLSVGDRVSKGEELVRLILELPIAERYALDTRRKDIAAALGEAKKRKELAELDYRRAVSLLKSNRGDQFLVKQVEWSDEIFRSAEEEEATVSAQASAFETTITRRDPKVTVVTAPIGGTITDIAFTPGELDETEQYRRLFTIADLSHVWFVANIFEKDIGSVQSCGSASLTPAGGSQRAVGAPLVVGAALNEKTRTLPVIFQTANPSGDLRLGTSATLTCRPVE